MRNCSNECSCPSEVRNNMILPRESQISLWVSSQNVGIEELPFLYLNWFKLDSMCKNLSLSLSLFQLTIIYIHYQPSFSLSISFDSIIIVHFINSHLNSVACSSFLQDMQHGKYFLINCYPENEKWWRHTHACRKYFIEIYWLVSYL